MTPFHTPPWDTWKSISLSERQKTHMFSPLYDASWISLVAAKNREEETLLKRRTNPGFDPKKKFEKGDGKGEGK